MRRDHITFDADGAKIGDSRVGRELSDSAYENRFRFQDIISNNLNTRRAVRELVLPVLEALHDEVRELRRDVEQLLDDRSAASKTVRPSRVGRK